MAVDSAVLELPDVPSNLKVFWPVDASFDGLVSPYKYRVFRNANVEVGALYDDLRVDTPWGKLTPGSSTFIHDPTNDEEDCNLARNAAGKLDSFSINVGTTVLGIDSFVFKMRIRRNSGDAAGVTEIGLTNSANTGSSKVTTNRVGVELFNDNLVAQAYDSGGAIRINKGTLALTDGVDVWLKIVHDATTDFLSWTVYSDRFITRIWTSGDSLAVTATIDEISVNNFPISGTATINVSVSEFSFERFDSISYDTTQGWETYKQVIWGADDSLTDMSEIKILGTDLEFRYAFGNISLPTNFSDPLSLINLQAETDPPGKFFRLQVRNALTDGITPILISDGKTGGTPKSLEPLPSTPTIGP